MVSDVLVVAVPTEQGWHGGQLGEYHFGLTVQVAEWRYRGAPPQSGERLAPGLEPIPLGWYPGYVDDLPQSV